MRNWQKTDVARTPEGEIFVALIALSVQDYRHPRGDRQRREAGAFLSSPLIHEIGHEVGIPVARIKAHLDR